jgi:hypothetical protein
MQTTFFLTDTSLAENYYGKNLYEFIVKKTVKLLTPFKVTRQTRVKSDLCNIYQQIDPNFTIKNNVVLKTDHENRTLLISYLKSLGFDGWVHPIERTLYALEVCLFSPDVFVEPNCKVYQSNKKVTYLKGFTGSCNKVNVETFLKARSQNSTFNKEQNLTDFSLYDHYLVNTTKTNS